MNRSYLLNAFCNLPKSIYFALLRKDINIQGFVIKGSIGAHYKAFHGESIVLLPRCVVMRNTQIEADGGDIGIGEGVFINRNCNIVSKGQISIGNGVSIGPGVMIYDHDHVIPGLNNEKTAVSSVHIGDCAWIGAGSVILKGAVIGEGAVIGAGCIVTGNVPPDTVYIQKRQSSEFRIG